MAKSTPSFLANTPIQTKEERVANELQKQKNKAYIQKNLNQPTVGNRGQSFTPQEADNSRTSNGGSETSQNLGRRQQGISRNASRSRGSQVKRKASSSSKKRGGKMFNRLNKFWFFPFVNILIIPFWAARGRPNGKIPPLAIKNPFDTQEEPPNAKQILAGLIALKGLVFINMGIVVILAIIFLAAAIIQFYQNPFSALFGA